MSTPRIVLDSNVVISGFLFGGPPARLLAIAVDGSARCFTSMPILDEIRDVLLRPKFGLTPDQVLALVDELHDLCHVVAPRERVRAVAADPDDNAILECAASSHADLIVSGDSHLLALGSWSSIPILSPADAVRRLQRKPSGAPPAGPRK